MPALSYEVVRNAVDSSAAAFRLTLKLDAVSPKVFPPTYEGGKYATEIRRIDGKEVPCVLLDSVPSQANRMELALQDADIELPRIVVDFDCWLAMKEREKMQDLEAFRLVSGISISSLQAPHRIVDAILRDSWMPPEAEKDQQDKKKWQQFRKSSIGKELDHLSTNFATPLLKYAPHCLVFGMWDSTGPRGGLGVKFARSVVSEIIGVNAVPGQKTSSRIDPLNIRVTSGVLYKAKDGGWTLDEKEAAKDKSKAIKLGKDGKPSEANHGNVTPSLSDGGFTIDYAEQTTVLSLPALRRLRFPLESGGKATPDADVAARAYLAALGLLGATLAVDAGYDLRSRCILKASAAVTWNLLGKPGDADQPFALDRTAAVKLYNDALAAVRAAKLPINVKEVILTPDDNLVTLVRRSMEISAAESGEGN